MVMLQPPGKARKIAIKVMNKTGLDKKNNEKQAKNKPLLMPYLQH
jgi:hypothetical protein